MYLPAPHDSSLFDAKSRMAGTRFQKLYEAVRLLDRYLSQFAVLMEDMEHVSLGDSFSREIANKQPGAHWEPIPKTFCHIDPLIVQKLIIFLLDLRTPGRVIVRKLDGPTLLVNTAFLGGYRSLLQGALRFSTSR